MSVPIIDQAFMSARMGTEAFLRVFDKDKDGVADTAVFDAAVLSAESIIRAKLAASHGDPLSGEVPQYLKDICAMLVPFEGTKWAPGPASTPQTASPYKALWDQGISCLNDLAKDRTARLPAGPGEPTASVEAYVNAPTPLFSQASISSESDETNGGYSGF